MSVELKSEKVEHWVLCSCYGNSIPWNTHEQSCSLVLEHQRYWLRSVSWDTTGTRHYFLYHFACDTSRSTHCSLCCAILPMALLFVKIDQKSLHRMNHCSLQGSPGFMSLWGFLTTYSRATLFRTNFRKFLTLFGLSSHIFTSTQDAAAGWDVPLGQGEGWEWPRGCRPSPPRPAPFSEALHTVPRVSACEGSASRPLCSHGSTSRKNVSSSLAERLLHQGP